jgi:ribonuclease P protein component
VERLKARAAFRAVARGKRISRPGFVLQGLKAATDGRHPPRFGFTVTNKIGNAVVRNRIRRRLREAVRLAGAAQGEGGTDYVLVGRRAALSLEFDQLVTDLLNGITALLKRDDAPRPRS